MTPETLAAVAGAILSLAVSYVPGIALRYNALNSVTKRAVMALLLIVAAALSIGAGCIGAFDAIATSCDSVGAESVVRALIFALMANQAAYQLSPASSEAA